MPISLKTLMGGGVPIGGITQLSVQPGSPLVEISGATYLESGYVLRGESANYPEAAALMTPNYRNSVIASNDAVGNAYSCTYGAGRFVVVGQTAGVSLLSTDGLTWTTGSLGSVPAFSSGGQIAFGNGKFVAAGGYSSDGITWSAASGAQTSLRFVRFLNGRLVSYAGGVVRVSTDGVVWGGDITSSGGITNLVSGAYGNGKYVVVGGGGKVTTSTDAITWAASATSATDDFTTIAFGAGVFVAAAAGKLYRSTDGLVWTLTRSFYSSFNSITFAEGSFYAGTRGNPDVMLVSKDGLNWYTPYGNNSFRLGTDGVYASDKKIIVWASETTYIRTIFTDQIGLPRAQLFGNAKIGTNADTDSNERDFVRVK